MIPRAPRNRATIRAPAFSAIPRLRDRPLPFKGRHWIAFWLVALLAALWLVHRAPDVARSTRRASSTDLREERALTPGAGAPIWATRARRHAEPRPCLPQSTETGTAAFRADTEIILIPTPSDLGNLHRPQGPVLVAKPLVRLRVVGDRVGLGAARAHRAGRAGAAVRGSPLRGQRRRAQRTEARRARRAPRHAVRSGTGHAIALTQETYHVGIAPNELRDPARDVPRSPRAAASRPRRRRARHAAAATPGLPARSPRSTCSRFARCAACTSSPCCGASIRHREFARAVIREGGG